VTVNLPGFGHADDIWAVRAAIVVVCLIGFANGCGGENPPPPRPAPAQPPPARVEADRPLPGTLWREDVDAAIKAGVGRFLHDHLEVEPAFDNGAFAGFRVVRLEPPEFWRGVDLAPGDVVTSVNGLPIERETQAHEALLALKTAKELRVTYLRGGEERTLVFAIVPREKS
jgi:S1-C subfamily serine protease